MPHPLCSPLHEATALDPDHPLERTPTTRDFSGRMSPISTSALADDYLGSSHSAPLSSSHHADASRGRVAQLEQQLRDGFAAEERLKRQLDNAKVR
jgi:hypothetical protein